MNKKGFTMVEIIMVVVLIGLLFALALPAAISFSKRTKEKAKDTRISLIEKGAGTYGEDNSSELNEPCYHLPDGVVSGKCKTVTLYYLYKNNYIDVNDLLDPTLSGSDDFTSSDLSEVAINKLPNKLMGKVEIQYYYNRYYAKYFED